MKFARNIAASKYKAEREQRGTQTSVAALLDVRQMTISDRENGVVPIHREAWLALLSLPLQARKGRSEVVDR